MKIEMGESLFYSWLKHVKECQIVQTNWTVSPQWTIHNEEKLSEFMRATDKFFEEKYGYGIYKQTHSFSQLLRQAEADVVGICFCNEEVQTYAVDVAFHESGLNYGTRRETVERIIKKSIRTAICLNGYLGVTKGEIIFASPKIHNAVLADLAPCIVDINNLLKEADFDFVMRIIANDEFESSVLNPILLASNGISDTSELFLRSYQLCNMFSNSKERNESQVQRTESNSDISAASVEADKINISVVNLSEMKIGKIAQTALRQILVRGLVTQEEVNLLQTVQYSKQVFDLQYPLLVQTNALFEKGRYYSKPLSIYGQSYYMCSQWFEVPANNDRPYLIKWIALHS